MLSGGDFNCEDIHNSYKECCLDFPRCQYFLGSLGEQHTGPRAHGLCSEGLRSRRTRVVGGFEKCRVATLLNPSSCSSFSLFFLIPATPPRNIQSLPQPHNSYLNPTANFPTSQPLSQPYNPSSPTHFPNSQSLPQFYNPFFKSHNPFPSLITSSPTLQPRSPTPHPLFRNL